jgi:hypothetical protein
MIPLSYKGFAITARTFQVRGSGRSTLDLLIGRHTSLRAFSGPIHILHGRSGRVVVSSHSASSTGEYGIAQWMTWRETEAWNESRSEP